MRGKLAHWFGSGIYLGLGDWWKRMQRQGPRLPVKDQAEPGNTAASLAIMWLWKLRISNIPLQPGSNRNRAGVRADPSGADKAK